MSGIKKTTHGRRILSPATNSDNQSSEIWRETDRLLARAKELELEARELLTPKYKVRAASQHRPQPLFTMVQSGGHGWERTDYFLSKLKELEQQAREDLLRSYLVKTGDGTKISAVKTKRLSEAGATSHYWSSDLADEPSSNKFTTQSWVVDAAKSTSSLISSAEPKSSLFLPQETNNSLRNLDVIVETTVDTDVPVGDCNSGLETPVHKDSSTSLYFISPDSRRHGSGPKRPPGGTVSCLPFPSLNSPTFGLVQEKEAHDPFWLLVAITFLIRTSGRVSIPVFYQIKERFPSPGDIADPSNADEIINMIRHLGLSMNRLKMFQKYADAFLHNPPRAGKVYRVRKYGKRDIEAQARASFEQSGVLYPADLKGDDNDDEYNGEALEIGHITQGKYALDNWRIFCRDVLLGRADDWNGGGREPEFQPEWMRVKPDDKELRAYLRWMWMREGWEWDPVSGKRTVLRREMMEAVNDGKVEWDNTGRLRIMDDASLGEVE